jgi:hypothetical protein
MTGEEMERAIEFLIRSQANLETQIRETNRQLQTYAETQTEFIQIVTRTLEGQAEINSALRAAVARTDERLDRLEAVVERIAERLT